MPAAPEVASNDDAGPRSHRWMRYLGLQRNRDLDGLGGQVSPPREARSQHFVGSGALDDADVDVTGAGQLRQSPASGGDLMGVFEWRPVFTVGRRGYSVEEVDSYIAGLTDELHACRRISEDTSRMYVQAAHELASLQENLQASEQQAADSPEWLPARILDLALAEAAERRAAAEAEAQHIVVLAGEQADRIVQQARERAIEFAAAAEVERRRCDAVAAQNRKQAAIDWATDQNRRRTAAEQAQSAAQHAAEANLAPIAAQTTGLQEEHRGALEKLRRLEKLLAGILAPSDDQRAVLSDQSRSAA